MTPTTTIRDIASRARVERLSLENEKRRQRYLRLRNSTFMVFYKSISVENVAQTPVSQGFSIYKAFHPTRARQKTGAIINCDGSGYSNSRYGHEAIPLPERKHFPEAIRRACSTRFFLDCLSGTEGTIVILTFSSCSEPTQCDIGTRDATGSGSDFGPARGQTDDVALISRAVVVVPSCGRPSLSMNPGGDYGMGVNRWRSFNHYANERAWKQRVFNQRRNTYIY